MSDVILTNRLMGNTFINSAVLEVISNYGSDITITNSTLNIEKTCTSLDSHILSTDITKSVYYFIIPSSLYGIYTVTANNNGNSDIKEITINNN